MSELATFQEAFSKALRGEGDLSAFGPPGALDAGLRVYRNTCAKGAIDALRGAFPAVERLVGTDWFGDCARIYALAAPPSEPSLLAYGGGFPSFLEDFAPATDLPYLPAVAALDWLWNETHLEVDALPFSPAAAAAVAPDDLFAAHIALHSSARIAWFDLPAASIWRANREPSTMPRDGEINWKGEGLLLVRPHGEVVHRLLDAPAFAFLDACRGGRTLGEAASVALAAEPDFDLARVFADLLQIGAFAAPVFPSDDKDRSS